MRQHLSLSFNSRIILGFALTIGVLLFLLLGSITAHAQQQRPERSMPYGPHAGYSVNGSRFDAQGRYLGPDPLGYQNSGYPTLVNRPTGTATVAEPTHAVSAIQRRRPEPQQEANPNAPEQSDLLRNSKDPDFILRNFKTMWVDARDAQCFGSDQMKAALGSNKELGSSTSGLWMILEWRTCCSPWVIRLPGTIRFS